MRPVVAAVVAALAPALAGCPAEPQRQPPAEVDAGADAAARPDASPDVPPDAAAGPPDAAAGPPDAGVVPPDAADVSPDAGPPDAGVVPPDAGAAPPDAAVGPPDAGVVPPDADPGPPYAHTIAIDGVNDFTADETFPTTTPGYLLHVTWDASYVYLGATGGDVQSTSSPTKWWQLYLLGVGGGTGIGVTYGGQRPKLPFDAAVHLRWKTSNDYTNAQAWSGTAWTDAGWSFAGDVFRGAGNDFVELRVARSALGDPSTLALVSAFLNEQPGGEATFAGAPAGTFVDGFDPDYATGYRFNLAKPPSSAVVFP